MDVEGFTELYCENKEKPEMQCNGKCHLADQLADNEEKKQTKEIQLSPEVLMIFANPALDIEKPIAFYIEEDINYYFNTDLTDGIADVVFQPPKAKIV